MSISEEKTKQAKHDQRNANRRELLQGLALAGVGVAGLSLSMTTGNPPLPQSVNAHAHGMAPTASTIDTLNVRDHGMSTAAGATDNVNALRAAYADAQTKG